MASRHTKKKLDLHDPEFIVDRELSWLAFNDRVLEEAEDPTTPLLERLRFLGIVASNLDEFFMVRVSGIQEQIAAEVRKRNPAGFLPEEHFKAVHEKAHEQVNRQYRCYNEHVLPALCEEGVSIRKVKELSTNPRQFVRRFFDREVFPVLTPLAVDSGHPFPHLRNLSLNLSVRLEPPRSERSQNMLFAVVQVPAVLDRMIRIPAAGNQIEFVLLEDIIAQEIGLLFPGMKVQEVAAFRVTRDADVEFAEEEADDLLKSIEEELRQRERGNAVRIGIEDKMSKHLAGQLARTLGLSNLQVYRMDGPINLVDVGSIVNAVGRDDLKFPPFVPSQRDSTRRENIFSAAAREDILVHHPYESFSTVEDFITQAAKDPAVLAIKQTLYRTSGHSPVIRGLMAAAESGKQVAALVELKARFDEERNISWARQMEKAGVHVVYGLVGLKTHAKICLVVRKEEGGIRRYVHLGTGNYNPITARIYTDLGLITCDPDLCDDATELFNLLTGYSRNPKWRKMVVAPINMRRKIMRLIDEQMALGNKGRIRAKMNSLVDQEIIVKLYEASRAGVRIDLVVRGICCLRPGLPDISENISVCSIIGRFLEHSRIFIFGDGENEQVFLTSADWMPRNLDRRVEAMFPIEAPALKRRVVEEIFETALRDNVKRRVLKVDGNYERVKLAAKETPLSFQQHMVAIESNLRDESRQRDSTSEVLVGGDVASSLQPLKPLRPAKPAARTLRVPAKALLTELHSHNKGSSGEPTKKLLRKNVQAKENGD